MNLELYSFHLIPQAMTSCFTIYYAYFISNIGYLLNMSVKISNITYKISYILYRISDIECKISYYRILNVTSMPRIYDI